MNKELELFIENTRSLFGIELQAETLDGAKRTGKASRKH